MVSSLLLAAAMLAPWANDCRCPLLLSVGQATATICYAHERLAGDGRRYRVVATAAGPGWASIASQGHPLQVYWRQGNRRHVCHCPAAALHGAISATDHETGDLTGWSRIAR